jgi:hypothetical protein
VVDPHRIRTSITAHLENVPSVVVISLWPIHIGLEMLRVNELDGIRGAVNAWMKTGGEHDCLCGTEEVLRLLPVFGGLFHGNSNLGVLADLDFRSGNA